MPLIASLTPEQEALIPKYREKWRSLFLSTERMDRQRAEGALRAAYTLAGKPDPEFRFLNGPQELQELLEQDSAFNFFQQRGNSVYLRDKHFIKRLESKFTPEGWKYLFAQSTLEVSDLHYQLCSLSTQPLDGLINRAMDEAWAQGQARRREKLRQQFQGELLIQISDYTQQLTAEILQALNENVWQPLSNQSFMQSTMAEWEKNKKIGQEIGNVLFDAMSQGGYFWETISCVLIDVCSSILDFSATDMQCWMTFRSVVRACGTVAAFEKYCLVIERPTKILLDAEGQIHADSEPAVTFADGSEFYVCHGEVDQGNFNP